MNLKSKHQVVSTFSMSSMTDVVFLLLIFFMLTASFITPAGLPVNTPAAKTSEIVMQKVSVTITEDLRYAVNDKVVTYEELEQALTRALNTEEEGVVVLHCDAKVPVEELVRVAGIATSLKAKVSLATKPEDK